MNAPLLFLGHAADRTGPPIYLLHFLRWLRENRPDVAFEIALLAGGELEDDFRELGHTSVYRGLPHNPLDKVERALLMRRLEVADRWWALRREHQLRLQMRQHAGCRVVHVNSAPSIELARLMPPGERVLLSHVHDLEIGLTHRSHPKDRLLFLEGATRLFAASEAVRQNLVNRHGIDPAVIAHHTEMIDARTALFEDLDPDTRARRRHALGLPATGPLVGASGTLDWRKAADIFLRLAWHLNRRERPEPVTFAWVGGADADIERAGAMARDLGVEAHVHFVGVQSDPVSWFRLMDVFVLPSREDPFPLVCLEAASAGVPVVAFDNGGMPELLQRGCGLVATYPDVAEMAAHVDTLLADPDRRRQMGDRGREMVRDDNDVSVAAPRLWSDIEPWLVP